MICVSIIGNYAHIIKASEPMTVADVNQMYQDFVRPQYDSIRANYEVISDLQKLDDELRRFFQAHGHSYREPYCDEPVSDLIITLTLDEQLLIDFVNFGCGLDFGFRRCGYFFKPNIPYFYQWYKTNFQYVTAEQIKKYCDLKIKIDLHDRNEEFVHWFIDDYCLYYDSGIMNKFEREYDKEYSDYSRELEILKGSFLERQYKRKLCQ